MQKIAPNGILKCFKKIKRDSRYSKYIVNYNNNYSDWVIDNVNNVLLKNMGLALELKKYFGTLLKMS
jgi:adenine-specific DNA-methyltransferase